MGIVLEYRHVGWRSLLQGHEADPATSPVKALDGGKLKEVVEEDEEVDEAEAARMAALRSSTSFCFSSLEGEQSRSTLASEGCECVSLTAFFCV